MISIYLLKLTTHSFFRTISFLFSLSLGEDVDDRDVPRDLPVSRCQISSPSHDLII